MHHKMKEWKKETESKRVKKEQSESEGAQEGL